MLGDPGCRIWGAEFGTNTHTHSCVHNTAVSEIISASPPAFPRAEDCRRFPGSPGSALSGTPTSTGRPPGEGGADRGEASPPTAPLPRAGRVLTLPSSGRVAPPAWGLRVAEVIIRLLVNLHRTPQQTRTPIPGLKEKGLAGKRRTAAIPGSASTCPAPHAGKGCSGNATLQAEAHGGQSPGMGPQV